MRKYVIDAKNMEEKIGSIKIKFANTPVEDLNKIIENYLKKVEKEKV